MPGFDRRSFPPIAHAAHARSMFRGAAPYVLAAALQAACAAWPCAALAQRAPDTASSASSSDRGDTLSSAASRQKFDEQRLLGGPSSSGNPYSANPYASDGASPDDAEDALTNEKHMHVVPPGDKPASDASGSGGRDARSDASSRSAGGGVRSHSRIGANGQSRAGNAVARNAAGTGGRHASAGYDYGASQTSPTAQVYGNPYGSPYGSPDEPNATLYKSPW